MVSALRSRVGCASASAVTNERTNAVVDDKEVCGGATFQVLGLHLPLEMGESGH